MKTPWVNSNKTLKTTRAGIRHRSAMLLCEAGEADATTVNTYVTVRWERQKNWASGPCARERGRTGDMVVVTGKRGGCWTCCHRHLQLVGWGAPAWSLCRHRLRPQNCLQAVEPPGSGQWRRPETEKVPFLDWTSLKAHQATGWCLGDVLRFCCFGGAILMWEAGVPTWGHVEVYGPCNCQGPWLGQ